ncbi:MAG: type II toxin-antitoxin system VapC family toxin [Candidatus Electrothrix aestuarii]|uniref:Type II toxin-antitoxin system VapC family toxin n=1 Tax=Candidatus Electrothrix aestuarii TaxID=3062594 RepID=A0AAU8LVN4_9BACT|nr:type II toxin-antitoxin system VapC family toxin [Candidatus Electrothrix aestuarii]
MIVADTNIITYFLLPSSCSDDLDALYKAEPDWAVPTLWRSEFRNVLALYLRKEIITLKQAVRLVENADSIVAHNEFTVSSAEVLTLVDQSSCSAYDCEFIALAHTLETQLVTQDKKVLREFPETAVSISDFFVHHN